MRIKEQAHKDWRSEGGLNPNRWIQRLRSEGALNKIEGGLNKIEGGLSQDKGIKERDADKIGGFNKERGKPEPKVRVQQRERET